MLILLHGNLTVSGLAHKEPENHSPPEAFSVLRSPSPFVAASLHLKPLSIRSFSLYGLLVSLRFACVFQEQQD